MLFSHMWLITVSDISGCHAIEMDSFEEKKNRISFKINVGTTNKCMVDKCKTISGLLLENL